MPLKVTMQIEINEREWTNGFKSGIVPVRLEDVQDALIEVISASNTFGRSGCVIKSIDVEGAN